MTGTELGTLVTYNPLAVQPETTVERLIELVDKLRMHHFPVVDEHQRLVGMISEADIFRALNKQPAPAHAESIRAEALLSGNLRTLKANATPREALQILLDDQVQSLPVLRDGRLLGIITTADFLREFSYGELACSRDPVSVHLPASAESLDPDVPAEQALETMHKTGQAHVAVVQGGCPIGLISQVDVMRAGCGLVSARGGVAVAAPTVADFMRPTPPLRPGQRMAEAAALMVEHAIPALVVTNQANRLVGVLTEKDVLRLMLRQLR